ncbi:MAG: hypothetical protein AB8E74_03635 [Prochlorococcus sp.]
MKLTDVVAQHGFEPCDLARIENARLYVRTNSDGVTELLCVQKQGELMQIDRLPLLIAPGVTLPVGDQLKTTLPKAELEGYLNTTLAAAA